jgi:hypothetical protein
MKVEDLIKGAMPDYFAEKILKLDLEPFHKEWIWAIYNNRRVAITAPTGYGKTTVVGVAYTLWFIMYHQRKQVLIVSKSMPQSIKLLEAIKSEMLENPIFKELVPSNKETWTKTEINTSTGCKIFCRPYSQNIKGFHVDLIICDEAASFQDHSIFYRFVVTRAIAKNGKVVCISTPENIADLMSQLATNPEYWSKTYVAEENGKSTWESHFPMRKLNKIRAEIGESAYQREYLCNPQAERDRGVFSPANISECYDPNSKFEKSSEDEEEVYIGCDFAIASGRTADYDSYVVVKRKGEFVSIIHGERHRGMPVVSKIDRLSELYEMYRPLRMIIDESMVGQAVVEGLREKGIPVEGQNFSAKSRNKLLVDLSRLITDHKLVIPRNPNDEAALEFTNVLTGELLGFVEAKTAMQSITLLSQAPHDDTVMSLALACKAFCESANSIEYYATG